MLTASLSSPRFLSLTIAHCSDSSGAGAGWGLTHSVQEIFQNHGVVFFFIPGREKQGQLLSSIGQTIEFVECHRRFRPAQLFEITFAEYLPGFGVGMEPLAQSV